jgi:hypothetical protein
VDDFHRIAKDFRDTAKHLHDVARNEVLGLGQANPAPPHIVRLFMVVERAGRESFTSASAA